MQDTKSLNQRKPYKIPIKISIHAQSLVIPGGVFRPLNIKYLKTDLEKFFLGNPGQSVGTNKKLGESKVSMINFLIADQSAFSLTTLALALLGFETDCPWISEDEKIRTTR